MGKREIAGRVMKEVREKDEKEEIFAMLQKLFILNMDLFTNFCFVDLEDMEEMGE